MVHHVDASVLVLNVPLVVGQGHVHDVSWILSSLIVFGNENLSDWSYGNIDTLFCFGSVDFTDSPPFDPAISTGGEEVISILNDDFKPALMERLVGIDIEHKMRLDDLTFPHNERSVSGS